MLDIELFVNRFFFLGQHFECVIQHLLEFMLYDEKSADEGSLHMIILFSAVLSVLFLYLYLLVV